jgi:hypothetical protein
MLILFGNTKVFKIKFQKHLNLFISSIKHEPFHVPIQSPIFFIIDMVHPPC